MTAPAILTFGNPRRRIARVPLLFRARDCEDELGIYALSYGKRVGLVHSRSGATGLAYQSDPTGRLIRVPADRPRLSWEMTTAGTRVRTLLMEPAAANLNLHSQALDNAAWTKSRASASANADLAPDGTLTADRLIEDSTAAASHRAFSADVFGITADGNVAVSRFFKAGTRSWAVLGIVDSVEGSVARVYFDLVTGAVGGTNVAGTGSVIRSGTESCGNGWYRCWVVANLGGGWTVAREYLGLATGDGGAVYTGDGASYISTWQGQSELGSGPTSIIPTAAAAASRAADSAYFPLLLTPQEMTVYHRQVNVGAFLHNGLTRHFFRIGESLSAPYFLLASSSVDPALGVLYRDQAGATTTSFVGGVTLVPRGSVVESLGYLGATRAVTPVRAVDGVMATGAVSVAGGAAAAWGAARAFLAPPSGFSTPVAAQSLAIDFGTRPADELRELVEVA
ncbi:MAG: phage head spike fiber domain-containing protein [Gemmatimonadaceae bacterium]